MMNFLKTEPIYKGIFLTHMGYHLKFYCMAFLMFLNLQHIECGLAIFNDNSEI